MGLVTTMVRLSGPQDEIAGAVGGVEGVTVTITGVRVGLMQPYALVASQ